MKSTRPPRPCRECNDGTMAEYGERDLSGEIDGEPYFIKQVPGWHCLTCGNVEFAQDDVRAFGNGSRPRLEMKLPARTRNPRYCLQCDDGTVLEFGVRDEAGEIDGVPFLVKQLRGWHCPVCGEIEFAQDDDSALRFNAAVTAADNEARRRRAEASRELARA